MIRTIRAALGRALLAVIVLVSLTVQAATPTLVRDLNSTIVSASSWPSPLGALNGKMLFGATDGTSAGVWVTDGTAAGTLLLARLADKPGSYGYPHQFAVVGNRAYFLANDGTHGQELWGQTALPPAPLW